jgi:DnaD/phage-associated family protein
MKKRDEKSEKARQSALNKWDKDQINKQTRSQRLSEARKKGKHTKQEWEEMIDFFGNTCVRCYGESGLNGVVKDHIIPIYNGGSDGISNLQPLCAKCNASKGPEMVDHRIEFCRSNGLEMPAEWLPNACETTASKGKESKVNQSKDKNTNNNTPPAPERTDIITSFEKEFARAFSPLEIDQIVDWEKTYPQALIFEALKRAVLGGKHNFKYINSILVEWSKNKIRTVQEVERYEADFKKRQDDLRQRREAGQAKPRAPATTPQDEKKKAYIRSLYL